MVSDFFFPILAEMESMVMRDSYLGLISNALGIAQQSVKADFQKYVRNRKPAYREETVTEPFQKVVPTHTERLTTAEDDLLYCLLHDVRLGNSVAQVIEPSWLDTKVVAGHILAKVLAEIKADGLLEVAEMEELLENDQERFLFQNLLYQDTEDEIDLLELANHCISVLFTKHSRKTEKEIFIVLQNEEPSPDLSENLRRQLKEIRNLRNTPPRIANTELENNQ